MWYACDVVNFNLVIWVAIILIWLWAIDRIPKFISYPNYKRQLKTSDYNFIKKQIQLIESHRPTTTPAMPLIFREVSQFALMIVGSGILMFLVVKGINYTLLVFDIINGMPVQSSYLANDYGGILPFLLGFLLSVFFINAFTFGVVLNSRKTRALLFYGFEKPPQHRIRDMERYLEDLVRKDVLDCKKTYKFDDLAKNISRSIFKTERNSIIASMALILVIVWFSSKFVRISEVGLTYSSSYSFVIKTGNFENIAKAKIYCKKRTRRRSYKPLPSTPVLVVELDDGYRFDVNYPFQNTTQILSRF